MSAHSKTDQNTRSATRPAQASTPARRIMRSLAFAAGLIAAAQPALAGSYGNNTINSVGNWNNPGNSGWGNHGAGNNGWGNNGWGNNGSGNNGWNNPPQPQIDTVSIDINRYISNEILPLRQLGGIGPHYNGRALRSVVVELANWSPAGQVQLLVNGQVVDSAYTGGKQEVELRPNQADVFGQEIQTLQLRGVGAVLVDDVEINVLRQANWGNGSGGWQQPVACQSIDRQVNTQVQFGQLNLNTLFNLSQYNGCRIGSVTFIGSTAAGRGQVAVTVNGTEATGRTQVASYPGQYTLSFWNQPAAGNNAPQLALNLMGNFSVQTVRLNLIRN